MFGEKKHYTVKPTGRAGIVYTEGQRKLSIFSEFLAGGDFDTVVYLSRVSHWDAPHGDQELTESDRERIKARTAEVLRVRIEWA